MADVPVVLYTDRMFRSRGEVHQWATAVSNYFKASAVLTAPQRTGRMARSIDASVASPGVREVEITLHVDTEYAEYTLRTTGPTIAAVNGMRAIPVGLDYAHPPTKFVKGFISGYSHTNGWLNDAYDRTARRFPALAGSDIDVPTSNGWGSGY